MTCCGGNAALAIAYGIPNVRVGGGFKSIGRELKRAADRVGSEIERTAKKVEREVSRVSDRISAEYGRLGRRVESQVERTGKSIAGAYATFGEQVGEMVSGAARWVRENPAVVGTIGAVLLPLGGWYLVAGAALSAFAAYSASGGLVPWESGFQGGDRPAAPLAGGSGGFDLARALPWGLVVVGLLLLWLLLR